MTISSKDRDVLARTLWGEARGEGLAGMIAVAWVIRNRVNDGKAKSWWGEGYAGVCQKPFQFSCWNKNDPNQPFLNGDKPIPAAQFALAQRAVKAVLDDNVMDPTQGATHYYATTMRQAPAWASNATPAAMLGRHLFFRGVV